MPVRNQVNYNQNWAGSSNNPVQPRVPPWAYNAPAADVNPRRNAPRARVNHINKGGIARVHAAIEHNRPNQQYAVIQTLAEYQGINFTILIDSGATHSFISLAYMRKLKLTSFKDATLLVELAIGKTTHSLASVGEIYFSMGGH